MAGMRRSVPRDLVAANCGGLVGRKPPPRRRVETTSVRKRCLHASVVCEFVLPAPTVPLMASDIATGVAWRTELPQGDVGAHQVGINSCFLGQCVHQAGVRCMASVFRWASRADAVSGSMEPRSRGARRRQAGRAAEEHDAGGLAVQVWSRGGTEPRSRGARHRRAGRAGVSREAWTEEHDAGGQAAQVCLGDDGTPLRRADRAEVNSAAYGREARRRQAAAEGGDPGVSRGALSRGARRRRAGGAGVSREHGAKEHDAGGLAAQVCLGDDGSEEHDAGRQAVQHDAGGQDARTWSRAPCGRVARHRRTGRAEAATEGHRSGAQAALRWTRAVYDRAVRMQKEGVRPKLTVSQEAVRVTPLPCGHPSFHRDVPVSSLEHIWHCGGGSLYEGPAESRRSSAAEGFGRAWATKWSSKSLASWSKEVTVPAFRLLYHERAGPCRVVGNAILLRVPRDLAAADYGGLVGRKPPPRRRVETTSVRTVPLMASDIATGVAWRTELPAGDVGAHQVGINSYFLGQCIHQA
uniref:Uncharacterized protein n=1 Tax=Musa acuminata TaxID=4641 RepID=Q1EP85_MUSAC|nr:hypothetical protein MA4_64C22.34 [Musa acuminata]